jgi:hypothetical protein
MAVGSPGAAVVARGMAASERVYDGFSSTESSLWSFTMFRADEVFDEVHA